MYICKNNHNTQLTPPKNRQKSRLKTKGDRVTFNNKRKTCKEIKTMINPKLLLERIINFTLPLFGSFC